MIKYNLRTTSDLISAFDITEGYAQVLLKKLKGRNSLSKNELRLIEIFERNKKVYKKI